MKFFAGGDILIASGRLETNEIVITKHKRQLFFDCVNVVILSCNDDETSVDYTCLQILDDQCLPLQVSRGWPE